MARTVATNFSGALQYPYATAATDLFHKEDVQTLALAVDQHTHDGAGKGLVLTTLPGAAIVDGSITLAKLAANSVDTSKIVDGTIATADLAANAITQSVIASATDSQSTTSASLAAIPNSSVTLTTTGGVVLVFLSVPLFNNGSATTNYIGLGLDAVTTVVGSDSATNQRFTATAVARLTPAAGAHTFAIYWSTTAGTLFAVTDASRSILAVELKR